MVARGIGKLHRVVRQLPVVAEAAEVILTVRRGGKYAVFFIKQIACRNTVKHNGYAVRRICTVQLFFGFKLKSKLKLKVFKYRKRRRRIAAEVHNIFLTEIIIFTACIRRAVYVLTVHRPGRNFGAV